MKRNRNNVSIGTPGASALMIIFAVLCLSVFAVLSLSTVLADVRLAEALNAGIDDWYAADSKAEEILAALREESAAAAAESVHSFTVPVSDTTELYVTAELHDGDYKILQWQTKYSAGRASEDLLQVWQGD